MPTARMTGTEVARIDTGGFFWSASYSCADLAEDFVYWFDKNSGDMFKAALPLLTGQATLTTVPNIGDTKAMAPHPTDAGLLVYFNVTDGVNTVDTTTGDIVQLLTTTAFNVLLNVGSLEMANLSRVKVIGTKFLLQGSGDSSGSWWEYDPVAGTAARRFAMQCLSRVSDLGPDPVHELMLSGYTSPSHILFTLDQRNSQIRVFAGTGGSDAMVDGDALTEAEFEEMSRIFRAASDLYYVVDFDGYVRWIQGGQVGSYAQHVFGGGDFCWFLPGRNMAVSVGVQNIVVWS